MAYHVNDYVQQQNQYRFHAAERHYLDGLEARGGLIRLDNVDVDAEQLVLRAFQCDSRWCLLIKEKDGLKSVCGSCCTDLEVDLTPTEAERVRALGRLGLEKLDLAPRDPLAVIARRMAEGKFLTKTEAGETAVPHLRSGCCPLGWITREGALWCGINGLCQALGLPLGDYKPDPCILFPLHYIEYMPGRYFLTVVCEQTIHAIGTQACVGRLRCLRRPKAGVPSALISLKNEIIHCFGAEFFRALAAAAIPHLERAGLEGQARQLATEAAAP